MTDPKQHREAGFYWICIAGQDAEVAQWQAEWEQWFVIGRELPLADDIAADVVVLSALLPPPTAPTAYQEAAE